MVIGAAEVGVLAALFGLAVGVSTVIGNFFILRYQMEDLRKIFVTLNNSVQDHEKRLIHVETVCHERHGGLA